MQAKTRSPVRFVISLLLLLQFMPANAADPATAEQVAGINYHHDISDNRCCLVIAHAGGAYAGRYYSNSLEALDSNYAAGRRVFEIDFRISTDGALLLAHDWKWNANQPLSRTAFINCNDCPLQQDGLTALDDTGLVAWLQQHPDALIITDAKDPFPRFLTTISRRIPESLLRQQFIFQVYDLADAELLAATLPGIPAIFTIYRNRFDEHQVDLLADFPDLLAVTLPAGKAGKLVPAIRQHYPRLPVYVHGKPQTINSTQLHATLMQLGASGFYLD